MNFNNMKCRIITKNFIKSKNIKFGEQYPYGFSNKPDRVVRVKAIRKK